MALFCLHIYFFSQFLIWSLDHYVMSSLSLITVFVLPSVCLMKVLPFQLWFPFVWNTLTQWKRIHLPMLESQKLQVWSLSQEDSPGGGNGNPLQYSCQDNFMDRGAWQATVRGVSKSQIQLSTHYLQPFPTCFQSVYTFRPEVNLS